MSPSICVLRRPCFTPQSFIHDIHLMNNTSKTLLCYGPFLDLYTREQSSCLQFAGSSNIFHTCCTLMTARQAKQSAGQKNASDLVGERSLGRETLVQIANVSSQLGFAFATLLQTASRKFGTNRIRAFFCTNT